MYTFVLHTHAIFYLYTQGEHQAFKNLSWMRVQISYHWFNNLTELLNRDLAATVQQGILSKDL